MPTAATYSDAMDQFFAATMLDTSGSTWSDEVFDATPFYFALQKSGNRKAYTGGRDLKQYETLMVGTTPVSGIKKGGRVSMTQVNPLVTAVYQMKRIAGNIVRYHEDDLANTGKNAVFSLVEMWRENLLASMIAKLENDALGDGTDDSDSVEGLQTYVPEDPTTGTVGGINRATGSNSYWRSQTYDMSSESFGGYGLTRMRNMWSDCTFGRKGDQPNMLLTTKTVFNLYDDEAIDQKQIVNSVLGDAEFESLEYKGKPIVWSPYTPAGYIWFLNMNHIYFRYHSACNFEWTGWKNLPRQPFDAVGQIVLVAQLTGKSWQRQGLIWGIS